MSDTHSPLLLLDIHHSGYLGWGVWVSPDAPERWTAETVERLMRHLGYKMGLNLGGQSYEHNPRLARRIRRWFEMFPDRLFLSGGDYAQLTACVRAGESNLRQLLVGLRETEKALSRRPMIWTMSEPGNFAQLPQILNDLGYRGAVLRIHGPGQRGSESPTVDKGSVIWTGPDGSEILSVPEYVTDRLDPRDSVTYSMWIMTRYRNDTAERGNYTLDDLVEWKERMANRGVNPVVMSKDDDHNDQYPNRNLCMKAGHDLAADTEGDDRFRWVTAEELIDLLPSDSDRFPADPNLFETRMPGFCDYGFMHNRDWEADLAAERALALADFATVLAAELGDAPEEPGRLDAAWKSHLAAQNHDLSLKSSFNLMFHMQYEAARLADSVRDGALEGVLGSIDTGEDLGALVILNPSGHVRRDYVTVDLPVDLAEAASIEVNGAPVPWEEVDREAELATMGFVAEVPSLGYASYRLRKGPPPVADKPKVNGLTVSTEHYQVRFGQVGGIESLSIPGGPSVVQPGSVGLAGDIGGESRRSVGSVTIDADGPLSVIARETGELGLHHRYAITYRMTPGVPWIAMDIHVHSEFMENTPGAPGSAPDPERKLEFSVALGDSLGDVRCMRLQPFLVWEYDYERDPVFAAPYWTDYRGENGGLALFNRGAIGQRWDKPAREANVILGAGGLHWLNAELAIMPHKLEVEDVHGAGLAYGIPMHCVYEGPHDGDLPGVLSMAGIAPANLTVGSVYRQDGGSFVRLWEHAGREADVRFRPRRGSAADRESLAHGRGATGRRQAPSARDRHVPAPVATTTR